MHEISVTYIQCKVLLKPITPYTLRIFKVKPEHGCPLTQRIMLGNSHLAAKGDSFRQLRLIHFDGCGDAILLHKGERSRQAR
jgi:hypothetical protein